MSENIKIGDLSPVKLQEESHVKYVLDDTHPSLVDAKEWSKSIADALDKSLLTTILRDASLLPSTPLSGGSKVATPPPVPNMEMYGRGYGNLTDQCLEAILICMPHMYGYMPVLPNRSDTRIELTFGKLGWEKRVSVIMSGTSNGELQFHIVDGKTYNHLEIRFLAMDIVETIKERNGIDDSEQDNKGSD